MSKIALDFKTCDALVERFETVVKNPVKSASSVYYTGIDLGTACVVLAVFDEDYQPVAGAYQFADVVRDGMVVDYIGAVRIVRELKAKLEEKLGAELLYASAAIPPGTDALDSGVIRHVAEGAGFEITALLDEPTAANAVLNINDGAVVDIGGGTTGISILQNGKVVYTADEATGGTHLSLVVAGAYRMGYEDAELYKRDEGHHTELMPVLKPVLEKISSIITSHIRDYDVDAIYLVGGTCCLNGIEKVIEKSTGIPTFKPKNPMFVTPLGIGLNCTQEIMG